MTLTLYLSRSVGVAMLAGAAVLVALGLGLDLMEAAGDADRRGGLLRYAMLRAPEILRDTAPAALLAGAVAGFLRLSARSELTALRAAGLGMRGVLLRLLPLGLAAGLVLHLNAEVAVPAASRALEADRKAGIGAPTKPVWVRVPGAVLSVGALSPRPGVEPGAALVEISLFALDDRGRLQARIEADSARFDPLSKRWRLLGVTRRSAADGREERLAGLDWPLALDPGQVAKLAGMPAARRSISAAEARAALRGDALPERAPSAYAVRAGRAWSVIAIPMVMLLLAAPGGLSVGRGTQAVRRAMLGLALGFCYLAFDGVAAALGERAIIEPLAAVWGPVLLFSLIGFWVLMLAEE